MIAWPILLTRGRAVAGWALRHIHLILLALLMAYAVTVTVQRNRARSQARSNALALDSAQAAAAITVERTEGRITKVLGDSLRAYERRTIQAEVARDEIDKAFQRLSIARNNFTLRIDTVRASGTTSVSDSGDVHRGVFTVREEPVTITAAVAMPKPPAIGRLDATIIIDSIPLGVRLQCGDPVRGIKPATIVVTTPPWMNARIEGTEQKPELCNPIFAESKHRGVSKWWIPVSFGLGVALKEAIEAALDKK